MAQADTKHEPPFRGRATIRDIADLAGVSGAASLHVAISPMPDRWTPKIARLETPISPRGESS